MEFSDSIFVVDSHTVGHPTRVVVGGLPKLRGDSVAQKRDYLRSKMDHIRNFLCNEPRGHDAMVGAILTEPSSKEADFGVIFCNPIGYDDMCGHGTIGVSTVLIETGMVMREPSTKITLEMPAGLIRVKAKVKDGKVKSVSFINIPAFLYKEGISINVPGHGEVKGDVAFGGNWFFYVNAKEIGVRVRSENIDDLIKTGNAIKNAFDKEFDLVHPTDHNISKKLGGVSILDSPVKNEKAYQNNVVVVGGKVVDRSPCGTGTCGRMAILFAKNKLALNEVFVNESIIGTIYHGKLIKETKVGEYPAVIPEITGSAYITGFNHIVLDPDDPFGSNGFLLGRRI